MAVYVDTATNAFRRMVMCHMVADTFPELHAMADLIGLRRSWFQANASFPHYDLAKGRRAVAVKAGAIEVDRRSTLAAIMKRLRADPAFIDAWRLERC